LIISFYGKGVEANTLPFFLTKTQRRVLVALLTSPLVIQMNQDVAEMMERLGSLLHGK
jgi:hypothetical protein